MVVIHWIKNKPFVYRSERVNTFDIVTGTNGKRNVVEKQHVHSKYLGSYRTYRKSHPDGCFEDMITTAAKLKLLSQHPERLDMLRAIDDEVGV